MAAGYVVDSVDLDNEIVVFKKIKKNRKTKYLEESSPAYGGRVEVMWCRNKVA